MDRRIKYRHIEAFVEISRFKSLKHAGEQIGLTQPAMTKTLKDLEAILGVQLMERDRGGVRLTPPGEVFLQFAQASLGTLEQGLDSISKLRTGGGGSIAVGALPSVAARILPHATLRFREYSPDALLMFEDGPHGYLMDRLRLGALDLVVGRMGPPETMKGVTFTQLYSEEVVFVVRPGHPLCGTDSVRSLMGWPMIYPSRRAAIRPLVDRLFVAEGLGDVPNRVESVSGGYGRGLIRNSDAVWAISEGVVATDIEQGLLVRLPIDTRLTAGPVGSMTRADEALSPLVRVFRRALVAAADALEKDRSVLPDSTRAN